MACLAQLIFFACTIVVLAGMQNHTKVDIVDRVLYGMATEGTFDSFLSLVHEYNISAVFKSFDALTLIAPTDVAFQSIWIQDFLERLSDDQIVQLLMYHALPKLYTHDDLRAVTSSEWVPTVASNGSFSFRLMIQPGFLVTTSSESMVHIAQTIEYDPVMAYEITMLLIPRELKRSSTRPPASPLAVQAYAALKSSRFYNNRFLEYLEMLDLLPQLESLQSFTMFVPDDAMFQDFVKKVRPTDVQLWRTIRYHIVPSYYGPEDFEAVNAPLQTLASRRKGAGYRLMLQYWGGGLQVTIGGLQVTIGTGVVEANIIYKMLDQKPFAIYCINEVLLPKEIFS